MATHRVTLVNVRGIRHVPDEASSAAFGNATLTISAARR
jgi:hypothetical protein